MRAGRIEHHSSGSERDSGTIGKAGRASASGMENQFDRRMGMPRATWTTIKDMTEPTDKTDGCPRHQRRTQMLDGALSERGELGHGQSVTPEITISAYVRCRGPMTALPWSCMLTATCPPERRTLRFTGARAVELVREPCPMPGPGQVLVATIRSLISTGTELTVYTRNFAPGTHWDTWVNYPFYPGYLSAGRVIAVGAGVSDWGVGDRIASRANHTSHALIDVGDQTRANDPASGDCTPANRGLRIPIDVPDEAACWMGLGKIVQVGVRAAEHVLGDVVVVIGLGLLGQLTVQYARLAGAARVIAIDTAPLRLELARAHGATDVICGTATEAAKQIRAIAATHGIDGADVVYDVTGHPSVLAQALPLARRFGKVVLLGDAGDPSRQTLTPDVITRGVRIVAAHDGHPPQLPNPWVRWSSTQMSEQVLEWLSRGSLRTASLVTHRYAPEQALEAYTLLDTKRTEAMGVVFTWE